MPGKESQLIPVREDFPLVRPAFPGERCGWGWEPGSAPSQCLVSGRPLPLPTTKEITATGGEWGAGEGQAKAPRGWGRGEEDWKVAGGTRTVTAFMCDQP